MLLNSQIGPDPDNSESYIDGSRFADEMYYWKAQGKKLVVKINSPGGRVDHGWSMIDAILECGADTENVGIAFSMGGIALMFGQNRSAYDYSSCMIHAPRGGSKTTLEVVKNQFRALLERRTKFTKEEIDDMMTSGKDYFFDAWEMLEKGIVDEVIDSGKRLNLPQNASAAELCAFYNSYIEKPKNNEMEFKDVFASIFGGKNETENVLAATQMKAENEQLKASIAGKDAEVANLKKEIETLKGEKALIDQKAKATELIEAAEKAGKFNELKPEDKAKLIESAVANYDATKLMIDNMKVVKTTSAASFIDPNGKNEAMDYETLANKNPKLLAQIAEENPELFNKMADEYIQKNKK